MAMVDVDGSSQLSVDSQHKLVGLVWGLVATHRSVCIHQMNWVNSRNGHAHDDSTIINIITVIIINVIIIIIITVATYAFSAFINQLDNTVKSAHS